MCGTSMAAPTVLGIAALVIEQFRRTYSADPWPSTVKALLVQGAVDLDDGTTWYNPGPDYASGYGVVDAKASVDLIIDRALREDTISVDDEVDTFTITVPSGLQQLKVTLAWDDPAATENISVTLINDLDLALVDPGDTVVRPWVLDPASPAANAATGIDRINNLEQVLVIDPLPGTWQITVRGFQVPEEPQDYSLVSELLAFQNVYLPLVLRGFSPGAANQSPNVPSSPSPPDGATEQDVDGNLSWARGDPDSDDVTYDVYVADGDVARPDVLACYHPTTATCDPGTLGGGNQYSWQVIATDEHGASTVGPVWDFTTVAAPAEPWTVIFTDTFEGPFPGPWQVYGDTYYWGKRDCRPYGGSYSAWAVGAGGGPLACFSDYPDAVDTRLVYGPFDLSDATAADVVFSLWVDTAEEDDYAFFCAAGESGVTPNQPGDCGGYETSSYGWADASLDLANVPYVGSLLGEAKVWIVLQFYSNGSDNSGEGAYVDNVVIRKCTHDTCVDASIVGSREGDSTGLVSWRRALIFR